MVEERNFNILNFNEFVNFILNWEVPPLFLYVAFFFTYNLFLLFLWDSSDINIRPEAVSIFFLCVKIVSIICI